MKQELIITQDVIDEPGWMARRQVSPEVGAVVSFVGVVRGTEAGETIAALNYEVFDRMARHQFARIFEEMERRWLLTSVRLVHRVGVVRVGEPSLCVEVAAAHRAEAFAACQFLIDEMKRLVPIWKQKCSTE